MNANFSLKTTLEISLFYTLLQKLILQKSGLEVLKKQLWKFESNTKIIDIGCGPGNMIQYLPQPVNYLGIDVSEAYIKKAKELMPSGIFFIGDCSRFMNESKFNQADLVMCNGVLHHLNDDEVCEVFNFVEKNIKRSGGRFIAFEPVHLIYQPKLSTWFMNQDRGKYVRTESRWKELFARRVSAKVNTQIAVGISRFPWNHILIECQY